MRIITAVSTVMFAGLIAYVPVSVAMAADTMPACTSEDASSGPLPCRWDASSHGNGQGESFTAAPGNAPGEACYRYADPSRDVCRAGVR